MKSYKINYTKNKEVSKQGAVRNSREGKGRYDLIPPKSLKRLANVYERGCVAYSERNWEKGMPYCRFIDSAIRHIYQFLDRQKMRII